MKNNAVLRVLVLCFYVDHVNSYPFRRVSSTLATDSDLNGQLPRPASDNGVKTITRPVQIRAGLTAPIPAQRANQPVANTAPLVQSVIPGVNFNVAFDRTGGSSLVQSRREWQSSLDETGSRRGVENQLVNSVWQPHLWNTDTLAGNRIQVLDPGRRASRRRLITQNTGPGVGTLGDNLNGWGDLDVSNSVILDQPGPTLDINGFVRTDSGRAAGRDNRFSVGLDVSRIGNRLVNNGQQGRRVDAAGAGWNGRDLRPQNTLGISRDQPLLNDGIFDQRQVIEPGVIRPTFPNQNIAPVDFGRDRTVVQQQGGQRNNPVVIRPTLPNQNITPIDFGRDGTVVQQGGQRNIPVGGDAAVARVGAAFPLAVGPGDVTTDGEAPVFSVGQEKERTLASADSSSYHYNFSY